MTGGLKRKGFRLEGRMWKGERLGVAELWSEGLISGVWVMHLRPRTVSALAWWRLSGGVGASR